MPRDVFASSYPNVQLQPFEAIQTINALPMHVPTLRAARGPRFADRQGVDRHEQGYECGGARRIDP